MPDASNMLTAELALFRLEMIAHNAAVFSCPSLMTELTYTANTGCAKGLFTAASAECEAIMHFNAHNTNSLYFSLKTHTHTL